jgi:hypothetical protein
MGDAQILIFASVLLFRTVEVREVSKEVPSTFYVVELLRRSSLVTRRVSL